MPENEAGWAVRAVPGAGSMVVRALGAIQISRPPEIVIPAQAGIQYTAASRFNHCCLWNTGSPPEPVIGRPFGRPGGGDDSWI